jgi:type II secretory pathway pseudopilin PulG
MSELGPIPVFYKFRREEKNQQEQTQQNLQQNLQQNPQQSQQSIPTQNSTKQKRVKILYRNPNEDNNIKQYPSLFPSNYSALDQNEKIKILENSNFFFHFEIRFILIFFFSKMVLRY